jgi:hypothetical protein
MRRIKIIYFNLLGPGREKERQIENEGEDR